MSLKNIIDCFQQGRKESNLIFFDNKSLVSLEPLLFDDLYGLKFKDDPFSSYSRAEVVSYSLGVLSRPRAIYEIAKFFISGQYIGVQGTRQEELDDRKKLLRDLDELKEK